MIFSLVHGYLYDEETETAAEKSKKRSDASISSLFNQALMDNLTQA